jgi:SPRY domain-containing SOCS box protein 1/4
MGGVLSSLDRRTDIEFELQRCGKRGTSVKRDDNGDEHARYCNCIVMPKEMEVLLTRFCQNQISSETIRAHAWNEDDASPFIYVDAADERMAMRMPSWQTTDAIRGKLGFRNGIHIWHILWETTARGSHAVVGVATKELPLHCQGYQCLVGQGNSFGWDIVKQRLVGPNGRIGDRYPRGRGKVKESKVPFYITVGLDMSRGTLAFMTGGKYHGVAHRNLQGLELYPCVSSVFGWSAMGLVYVGGMYPEKDSLRSRCREKIYESIGNERMTRKAVSRMHIPRNLKSFLIHQV